MKTPPNTAPLPCLHQLAAAHAHRLRKQAVDGAVHAAGRALRRIVGGVRVQRASLPEGV